MKATERTFASLVLLTLACESSAPRESYHRERTNELQGPAKLTGAVDENVVRPDPSLATDTVAIDVYDNKIRIEPGAAAHVETTLESLCVDLKSFGQRSGNPSKGDAEMRAVLRVYPSTDHVVAAAIAGALKACGVQFSVKVQESEW